MLNLIHFQKAYIKPIKLLTVRSVINYDFNSFLAKSYAISTKQKPDTAEELNKYFERLQKDVAVQKKISLNSLNQAIDLAKSVQITSNQFQTFLESLSYLPHKNPEERLELLNTIFTCKHENFKFNENHLVKLLQIYKENKFRIDDYEKFLSELETKVGPNVYLACLDLCCELGDIDNTKHILNIMKHNGFPIVEEIFSFLIRAHSRSGNLSGCQEIIETMNAGNIEIGSKTYTELIRAYIENGEVEESKSLLEEKGILLNEQRLLSILESLIYYSCNRAMIPVIFKYLPKDTFNNTQIDPLIRNFLTRLIFDNKCEDVMTLISHLPVPQYKISEDQDRYAVTLINDFIVSNQNLEVVLKFCGFLMESKRNSRALHIAVESALHRDSPLILDLLEELAKKEKLRNHYFWPLLLSNSKHMGEAGVMNVLKLMKDFGLDPDYDTINLYVLPKLSLTLKDPKQALKIFDDHGYNASSIITPLISHLLYQNRFEEVPKIMKLYTTTRLDTEVLIWPLILSISNNSSPKNLLNIVVLVKSLINQALNTNYDLGGHLLMEIITNNKIKNPNEIVLKILDEFLLHSIKISTIAFDILNKQQNTEEFTEKYFKMLVDWKLSIPSAELFETHISHPRDMTLEQLECHLVELEAKNLNTRGVLRRLLQLNVKENNLDRALELKLKCDREKVEVSPGMLASIFDLYIKTKNVEKAEEIHQKLCKQYPGFSLDEHKIIDFAAVLVSSNQMKKAQKILQDRAKSGKVRGGENLQKNIWNLLTTVANLATENKIQENQSKVFHEFLQKLNYLSSPTNTSYGPIIKEYLQKNQIKLALQEYQEICKKTRKTPLQLEIVKLLIELGNQESPELSPEEIKINLQSIIEMGSKIHGSSRMNAMMVIATSESGTENQLRKLLMNQSINIDSEFFLKQCEFLSNSGKIEVLLKIGRCMRGLDQHLKINEMQLYNLVLDVLSRKNDTESAINLFESIINDGDLRLPTEFTRNVINLLERNKYAIPTSIAIYAK